MSLAIFRVTLVIPAAANPFVSIGSDFLNTESPILEKSLKFAARIVKMYQYLIKEKKEYILSKQILRSGTSIGANAHEAAYGASAADFAAKMQIALKETAETEKVTAVEQGTVD